MKKITMPIKSREENTRTFSFISEDYSQPIRPHLACFDSNRAPYKAIQTPEELKEVLEERKELLEQGKLNIKNLSQQRRNQQRKRALKALKGNNK